MTMKLTHYASCGFFTGEACTCDEIGQQCGEHDGTGYPCPTCDICDRSMCSTEDMAWNGETGNHVECEARHADH